MSAAVSLPRVALLAAAAVAALPAPGSAAAGRLCGPLDCKTAGEPCADAADCCVESHTCESPTPAGVPLLCTPPSAGCEQPPLPEGCACHSTVIADPCAGQMKCAPEGPNKGTCQFFYVISLTWTSSEDFDIIYKNDDGQLFGIFGTRPPPTVAVTADARSDCGAELREAFTFTSVGDRSDVEAFLTNTYDYGLCEPQATLTVTAWGVELGSVSCSGTCNREVMTLTAVPGLCDPVPCEGGAPATCAPPGAALPPPPTTPPPPVTAPPPSAAPPPTSPPPPVTAPPLSTPEPPVATPSPAALPPPVTVPTPLPTTPPVATPAPAMPPSPVPAAAPPPDSPPVATPPLATPSPPPATAPPLPAPPAATPPAVVPPPPANDPVPLPMTPAPPVATPPLAAPPPAMTTPAPTSPPPVATPSPTATPPVATPSPTPVTMAVPPPTVPPVDTSPPVVLSPPLQAPMSTPPVATQSPAASPPPERVPPPNQAPTPVAAPPPSMLAPPLATPSPGPDAPPIPPLAPPPRGPRDTSTPPGDVPPFVTAIIVLASARPRPFVSAFGACGRPGQPCCIAVYPFIASGYCFGASTCDTGSFSPQCLGTATCQGDPVGATCHTPF